MILDANVIVSASLGRSLSLVEAVMASGQPLFVPAAQMREAVLVTSSIAVSRGREPASALSWTAALLPVPHDLYEGHEAEARARLGEAGQKDWPLVALALASGDAVWSNDVDLFGTGIVVWNTRNISRAKPQNAAAGINGN